MKWFVLICLILTKCESGYTGAQHQFVLGAFASKEDMDMTTKKETVMNIALEKLVPFRDHPFQVRDDEQMQMITESIRSVGVLVPAIARPLEDGSFELISGHRRKHACEVAGLSTLPVIVRDVDQDTATVMMVDSNFQREEILPSERAKAYKMKLEAIKRQGALTEDEILDIMLEQKKPECWNLSLPMNKITKYFPESYTPQKMEETIIKLLEAWMRHRVNQKGR